MVSSLMTWETAEKFRKKAGILMEFRPCIDLHGGKVKQLVGGSLTDRQAKENFVSEQDAAFYARLYQKDGIRGGHIILLDAAGTRPQTGFFGAWRLSGRVAGWRGDDA